MFSSKEKGDLGEEAALKYLIQNGYEILDRNFRTRYGEIDIIGKDKDYIAFIEVKSRKDFLHGLPCEAVNANKQHRIVRMALLYIAKNNLHNSNFRFDVVETVINDSDIKYIRLIKDAFQVDSSI